MPTVLRVGAFRLFFFSNEGNEPPHIHVECGDAYAKFWLEPGVTCADAVGFSARDLKTAERMVDEHRDRCLTAWKEHFGHAQ
jgi:hypothetical protein